MFLLLEVREKIESSLMKINSKINLSLNTQMLLLGLRLFDQAEEELREVADDDKGWSQCWAAVVFHNQVVSLELPKDVCVTLHYLECVAVNVNNKRQL